MYWLTSNLHRIKCLMAAHFQHISTNTKKTRMRGIAQPDGRD